MGESVTDGAITTFLKKPGDRVERGLTKSFDAVKRICPKQALFIGMTHESDHHKDNEFLEEWSRRFE
ncbi:hypothetical protein ACLOJK_022241 [Asimina triloba]